jgi:parallel beta-helix repeat protein
MKSKKMTYFKYFSLFFAFAVLLFITGCTGVSPTAPIINSFSASPLTITAGESSTLSWSVTDAATTVTIDQGIGTVTAPSGSTSVSPTSTTIYTLTATNSAGSSTATVTITVISAIMQYTITSTSGAGGQIEPAGAIAVSEGESLTFTITPVENYQILDVLVDDASGGAVTTYTFTSIQQDHTIHAEFGPIYSWIPFVPVNWENIWGILILLAKRVYNNDTGIGYDTIQEAIDAAQAGHTIIVSSDTYYENIEFDNKNITVRSSDPLNPAIVAATIIDGGGSGSVVHFLNGDTSTLAGFTIQNGDERNGGGIFVGNYCAPTIANNTITNNTAEFGGGIGAARSAATITDNIITGNHATGYFAHGGGIYVFKCLSTLTINSNTIKDNTAGYGGGIFVANYSTPTVTNNTVTDNTAVHYGGGIYVDNFHCNLLPSTDRPIGWGTGIEAEKNIPPQYWSTVAGNAFSGNSHGGDPNDGTHVYFQP